MKEERSIPVLREKGRNYRNMVSGAILKTVSAMCMAAGLMGIASALGGVPVLAVPFFTGLAAVFLIFGIELITRGKSYGVLLCLLAAAAVFFLSVGNVIRGFYMWINHFLEIWNRVFGTFYTGIAAGEDAEADVMMAGVVLILLGGALLCELIRGRRLVLLTIVVLTPLCLSMILSVYLPVWIPAFLMTGWLAAWSHISGPSEVTWQTGLMIVCILAVLLFLPAENTGNIWQRTSAGFQTSIKQGISKLRYGEDSLPEGNLREASRMLAESDDRLELAMEEVRPVYLRGYVGAEYENNAWKPFTAEAYGEEYSGMLAWLERQGFHPGMQYAEYENVSPEEQEGQKEVAVSVKNVGADRRYIYLPETAAEYSESAGSWKQDWYLDSDGLFGQKEYSFTYYNMQDNAELQMPGSWIYQETDAGEEMGVFQQAEKVYRAFVYDKYLEIDEQQKEQIDAAFFQGDTWEKGDGLYTVTSRIRAVLRILASYEEIPARIPANQDFLSWFLEEGKEGNAAYYASAAVFAYRAAGIPARYAEGYVLTGKQAEQSEGNTVMLTGKNAHAWAEIYMDGLGWRPVEVTPGFYVEPYQADVVVAVPNEALEGNNGDIAALPSSEDYELPELPQMPESTHQRINIWILAALGILIVLILAEIVRLVRILYQCYRYRRMTGEEQMYFLHDRIMDMMQEVYREFNPEQPLGLPLQEGIDFDTKLYMRTVKRMEKIIYGQTEPAAREIPAAEAAAQQVKQSLSRKAGWQKRLKWRYIKVYAKVWQE